MLFTKVFAQLNINIGLVYPSLLQCQFQILPNFTSISNISHIIKRGKSLANKIQIQSLPSPTPQFSPPPLPQIPQNHFLHPIDAPLPFINTLIISITYSSQQSNHSPISLCRLIQICSLSATSLQSPKQMSGSAILGIAGRWNVLYGGFPRLLVFESNASQLTARVHEFADGMAIGAATIANNLMVEPLHGGVYFRFEQSGTVSEGMIDREGKELRGLVTVNQQKHQLQGFKDEQ